ncbi:hypothetical protein ACVCNR_21155 (plasmid) [Aquamicrobium terrae]
MVRSDIILVAAPDAGFRRSLAFALDSVGFTAAAYMRAGDAFASCDARVAACAVIDDDAVDDWNLASAQFDEFARPVILLVGLFRAVPALPFARHVMKPFLGEPLIEAVRAAVAGLG